MSLLKLTLKEASLALKNKECSSLELTNEYIKSAQVSAELNMYISETFDLAQKMAKDSDSRRAKQEALSDIDGIPVGVKDIFLVKDVKATNGSNFLKDFVAPYESTITQNLSNAGYVCMGKLNMDEFAMGSANLTSYFGPVVNPWYGKDNKKRVPGGSSGGSSAAVAARACLASLGSDTGGSIRQPASFTGTVGIKPTYGVCSRYGVIAFASSLDQAGPITRTVEDNAMMLQHMAGYDDKDSSMVKFNKPNYAGKIGASIRGLKVGIPKEYYSDKLAEETKEYWHKVADWLKEEGAEIIDVSLPHTEYALPIYYILAPAEAYSNLARFDGIRYGARSKADNLADVYKISRKEGWGEEVKKRVLVGSYNLLAENFDSYMQAAKVRRLVYDDFTNVFQKVDVILTPTTPSTAFALDETPSDPIEMYFNDLFTVTANLAGLPAISVPAGLSKNNLPIGIQFIGKHYKEDELYQYAFVVEQKAKFNNESDFVKKHNLY